MYRTILVPVDGSPGTRGAIVHALAVVGTDGDLAGLEADQQAEIRRFDEARGRRATATLVDAADDLGLDTVREIREGVPHREILTYAAGTDADPIVMGTRGRGLDSDRLLGSTTARVLRRSDRPILTVN